jgi:hypothetical protein
MEQPLIHVSFFQGLKKIPPVLRQFSVEEACTFFTPHFPPMVAKEDRQKEGHQFSFNIYKEGKTRGSDNVESMTGIVLDFDNKDGDFVSIESVTDKLYAKRLIYFWYTTWSHTASLPRWRLIIPFSHPLPKEQWADVYKKMIVFLGNPPGIDPMGESVAHMWYPPFRCAGQPFQAQARREGYLFNPLGADNLLSPLQRAEYEASKRPKKETRAFLEEANLIDDREICELLQFIGADDYHDWVKVGMTLHHHFGGTTQGFSLWNDWSRRSSKYKGDADLHAHWRTFERQHNPVTIGTLIYLAQENGYTRGPRFDSSYQKAFQSIPINSVAKEEVEPIEEEETDTEAPADFIPEFSDFEDVDPLEMPTPFLKAIFTHLSKASRYHNPVYALAATIVVSGLLMRKTFPKDTSLYTNFMALSVGPTGTGKTQIFRAVRQILGKVGQERHVIGRLISQQGFTEALRSREGCIFLLNDEASYSAEAMKNKNISHHELAVEALKLQLFSDMSPFIPPCAKGTDLTPIPSPFFCELSTSTHEILKAFTPQDFKKGLLPRYLLFKEDIRALVRNENWSRAMSPDLEQELKDYLDYSLDEPVERVFEAESKEILDHFDNVVLRMRNQCLENEDSARHIMIHAALTRVFEHVSKLSILASIRDDKRFVVKPVGVKWAIRVATSSFKMMANSIESHIFENRTEEMRARVLRIIEKHSKGEWVPKSKIMNFIRFLTNRELNDILLKLHDEGVIQIERRGEKQMYIRSMTRKGRSKK